MSSGPFFFAWVNENQTTFDELTMLVEDEDIFDAHLKHDENQYATLDLTVRNPRVGLLSAGRKLWGWFSYLSSTGHIWPLFFGVLTGIPTDMFGELVQLKFNARPHDFVARKQTVAETLKVRPYYDPVFLSDENRDDPDAILEGWSALYHIDRITHEVTTSDMLEGEDGTVTFDQSMGIYDSVKMELGECPLDVVQVQAAVQWTQRCSNVLPQAIHVNVNSYTGGSFKSDWPQPGAQIGGGWKCEASYVTDVLGTELAKSTSNSSTITINDHHPLDCSTSSCSVSVTSCPVPGIAVDTHLEASGGDCDPFGIPDSQDAVVFGGTPETNVFSPFFIPDGVNIPTKVNSTGTLALLWTLNCIMYLRYDAKREYTEELTINVQANVQATVTSPTLDQNTEVIKISGANVGLPLVSIDAWSDFAGQLVDIGQIIRPNDRTRVGGTSYQVCVTSGRAGVTEPQFSDTPGDITNDGTVVWSSVGASAPTSQPAWADSSPIPLGEIVLYEPKIWSDASGSFETTGQSTFLIAIQAGTTRQNWVNFSYIPSATSNTVVLPLPVNTAYIPGPGQVSPYSAPLPASGSAVQDGSVIWLSLGTTPSFLGIPIGGTTENVTARSYFSGERGLWSVEHLICKARARLRLRARCITVQWDAPFEDCLNLSLRKNATLLDGRIPGGACTGKIKSYELHADKDGVFLGHVVIGVAVGFGNSVPDVTGTPVYTAATGYMQPGYQRYDGGAFSIAEESISYTPPAFQPFDDGLSFPLQFFPGIVEMTTPNQAAAVERGLAAQGSNFVTPQGLITGPNGDHDLLGGKSTGEFLALDNAKEYALEATPVTCEIIIRPVTNGPFNGSIVVECSTLEVPQGINLSAG